MNWKAMIIEAIIFATVIFMMGFTFEWYMRGSYNLPVKLLISYFSSGFTLFFTVTNLYRFTKNSRPLTVLMSSIYGLIISMVMWRLLLGDNWYFLGAFLFAFVGLLLGIYVTRPCPKDALVCLTND